MGIRTRTLLVLTVIIAVIGTASLLLVASVVLRALHQRESLEVQTTLARANEAVAMQVDQLWRTGADWAVWDDTYRFVQDRNPAYVESNLTVDALDRLGVDLMGFLDSSGELVREVSVDSTTGPDPFVALGIQALLLSKPDIVKSGEAGVIATPRGPMMVSIQPVLRSDGTGPSAGTFFVGRYLGKSEADQLARVTGTEVSILPTAAAEPKAGSPEWPTGQSILTGVVASANGDKVTGYRQIQGLDGAPGFVVSITQPRTTMILARQTGISLLVASILASIALLVGLYVAIDMSVTRRLERLSSDVRTISHGADPNARVGFTGDDEIAALAEDINSMLAALQESQQELEYMAGHDMLTKLYNRHRFEEELDRELMEQVRTGGRGALLWLDIDNFKQVNDTLGHAVGDRLLTGFAQELKTQTRGYATLARIGGDEFAAILPTADRAEAEKAADRLVGVVRARVFTVEAHDIQVQISIGIALYPGHGTVADDLLVCADLAMYDAKNSGGNGYRVYDGQRISADTS
jgi:diguanylate cyclase (GGDEF)-like protein